MDDGDDKNVDDEGGDEYDWKMVIEMLSSIPSKRWSSRTLDH